MIEKKKKKNNPEVFRNICFSEMSAGISYLCLSSQTDSMLSCFWDKERILSVLWFRARQFVSFLCLPPSSVRSPQIIQQNGGHRCVSLIRSLPWETIASYYPSNIFYIFLLCTALFNLFSSLSFSPRTLPHWPSGKSSSRDSYRNKLIFSFTDF